MSDVGKPATPLPPVEEPPAPAPPIPTQPTPKPPPGPTPAALKALEHTGLPPSLLRWKPKLPSRNWSIFLTIVGSLSYAYYYDRQECARLKKEYEDRVRYLSKEGIEGGPLGYGRKVTVYAAKWPEDDEWERGLQYFKRYIKPVLVAAAVDYDMVSCPQYGALTRHISSHILSSRRRHLSTLYNLSPPLEPPIEDIMAGAPGQLSYDQKEQRRIQGGAVIIGRNTLKEYMQGLKDGYMNGIKREEREKMVERVLEGDGVFETKEDVEKRKFEVEEAMRSGMPGSSSTSSSIPPVNNPVNLSAMSFMNRPMVPPPTAPVATTTPPTDPETLLPEHVKLPPFPLPEQPTMLLVPWTNHLGFKQVPYMIWDLFTERYKYKIGGEAGLRLIFGEKREFVGKDVRAGLGEKEVFGEDQGMLRDSAVSSDSNFNSDSNSSLASTSDLDFDASSEGYYKRAFNETKSRLTKARESYYSDLSARLTTARELASGSREPTADEVARPPATEHDLRAERLKREIRWMNEEEGYEVVKKGQPVAWDARWDGWLKVYGDVPKERYPSLPVETKKEEQAV